jgi:DNA adenine methylase
MIENNKKCVVNDILNDELNKLSLNNSIKKGDIPSPLIKWVGGKSQIIDTILKMIPKDINNYYEIFVGGGSVLIMILWAKNNDYINIRGDINVYDLNHGLIGLYNNIKLKKNKLYKKIKKLKDEFSKCDANGIVNRKPENIEDAKTSKESYYYWIRKLYNNEKDKSNIDSSAYFVFLNKTGFRGMYREGPNGFNIPYGNYKNPKIIEKTHLEYLSELFKDVNFKKNDFSESLKDIKDKNNFLYFDPPYAPENSKSFVGYTKDGFNIEQHKKLFNLIKEISKDNMIMLSNSNVDLVRDNMLEKDYKYKVLSCKRSINSKNPSSKTEEVIITNY